MNTRFGLSRRAFATAAAGSAAIGAVRFPARAAEFTYRMAWSLPTDHQTTVRMLAAAQRIHQQTGGRMEVQIFPGNVLGSNIEVFGQLRLGALQFVPVADLTIGGLVPVAGITAVPFAFPDHKSIFEALDGTLGKYRRDAIAKANLVALEKTWPTGFRQTVNRIRPIGTIADFKGIKIRVDNSQILNGLFRGLGAVPTPVQANEIYPALQTHIVDGVDLPLDIVEAWKIYELAKFFSYTNHVYQNTTFLANGDAWQKLPPQIRDNVAKNFNQASMEWRGDLLKAELTLESTLKGQGMAFNHPAITIREYQAALRPIGIYATLRDQYGADAWALLEKTSGRLV